MADRTTTELDAVTSTADADLLFTVVGGVPKKITRANQDNKTTAHSFKISGTQALGVEALGLRVGSGSLAAWDSFVRLIDVGSTWTVVSDNSAASYIVQNAYYASAWKYRTTSTATKQENLGAYFLFSFAPSGTANTNITWTDTLKIESGLISLGDATNLLIGSTTGTKIGTATSQKLSFWNATPIVQPASANQAALSLDVDVTGVDTVDKAAINSNFSAIQTLVNQLRLDLVAAGIIKGAA